MVTRARLGTPWRENLWKLETSPTGASTGGVVKETARPSGRFSPGLPGGQEEKIGSAVVEVSTQRMAIRAALPLMASRIRRELRRALYPPQAMVRLGAAGVKPEAQLQLIEQIRQLPLDHFSDPD